MVLVALRGVYFAPAVLFRKNFLRDGSRAYRWELHPDSPVSTANRFSNCTRNI
jgi:hypothetical protein